MATIIPLDTLRDPLLPREENSTDWLGRAIVEVLKKENLTDPHRSARLTSQAAIALLSCASKIGFIAISSKAGETLSLPEAVGYLSAFANTTAFALLELQTGFAMINDELGTTTTSALNLDCTRQQRSPRRIFLLVPAALIAITSQLPSGLASFEYNNKQTRVAFAILLVVTLSTFPLRSTQLSLDALSRQPRGDLEPLILNFKRDLCQRLQNLQSQLLIPDSQQAIIAQIKSATSLEECLSYSTSIDQAPAQLTPGQKTAIKIGQIAGAIIGSFFVVNSGAYAYSLTNRFTDNEGLGATAGVATSLSMAYLSLDYIRMATSYTCLRIFNFFTGQAKPGLAEQLRPKITLAAYTAGILIDALALGATVVIYSNFDDYNKETKIAGATLMASGLFFILFNATLAAIDDLLLHLISYKGTANEKELIETYYKLEKAYKLAQKATFLDHAIHLLHLSPDTQTTLLSRFKISLDDLKTYIQNKHQPLPALMPAEESGESGV